MKVIYFLQYLMFLVFFLPIAVLPYGIAIKAGRALGNIFYYLARGRRRIATQNVQQAMDRGAVKYPGGADALVRENFRNMGRWFVEIVKVLFGFGNWLIDSVEVEGLENVRNASVDSRGLVLVSGHCGNWELLVLSLTRKVGRTFTGVARRQSNPYIDRFIVTAREKFGTRIIYKDGMLRKFISILRDGGVVGVMMDQHVSASMGVVQNFLGTPAWVARTPALIAKKTDSAIVPVSMRLNDSGRHVITFYPQVSCDDIEEATVGLSEHIEEFIKKEPTQWLWIHRRWKKTEQAIADTAARAGDNQQSS